MRRRNFKQLNIIQSKGLTFQGVLFGIFFSLLRDEKNINFIQVETDKIFFENINKLGSFIKRDTFSEIGDCFDVFWVVFIKVKSFGSYYAKILKFYNNSSCTFAICSHQLNVSF